MGTCCPEPLKTTASSPPIHPGGSHSWRTPTHSNGIQKQCTCKHSIPAIAGNAAHTLAWSGTRQKHPVRLPASNTSQHSNNFPKGLAHFSKQLTHQHSWPDSSMHPAIAYHFRHRPVQGDLQQTQKISAADPLNSTLAPKNRLAQFQLSWFLVSSKGHWKTVVAPVERAKQRLPKAFSQQPWL